VTRGGRRLTAFPRTDALMARGAAFLGTETAILCGAMSWVSERNLVAAISNGGGFGVIAAQTGFGAVGSSIAGLLGGIVFAGVVSIFGRFLMGQQASSSVSDETLLGRTAQVTVAIKSGAVGQITAKIGDERVERIARAKDGNEIAVGTIVKVDAVVGDSIIVVPEELRPY